MSGGDKRHFPHRRGRGGGLTCFCLEYLDRSSLADRLHGAPQLPRQAAGLVETPGRAAHHAYQRGRMPRWYAWSPARR